MIIHCKQNLVKSSISVISSTSSKLNVTFHDVHVI